MILKSGDDGIRTRDLSVANAALSQLSYVPIGDPADQLAEAVVVFYRLVYYNTFLSKWKKNF